MPGIVAFGDNVVDCYPDAGLMYPGGNALNVAVHAARHGMRAAYAGAVADDPAGRLIRRALAAEGVGTERLRTLPGRTAFCVIGLRDGEREFLRADLGVSIVAPEAADLDHVAGFDAVHTGRSSHVDAHLGALAARARLSFDFATVRDPARLARVAPHCFLASLSGGDLGAPAARDLALAARAAGAAWALVTRGAEGALLAGPDGMTEALAEPVEPVDTLGAGDAFIARALVGLLRGEAPAALMRAAAGAAAAACAHPGGIGHPAPLAIDESHARPISEIYAAEAG